MSTLNSILTAIYSSGVLGFRSASELWDLLPKALQNMTTQKEVQDWIEKQRSYQRFKRPDIDYKHIKAPGPGYLQIDLADMSRWESFNRKYAWLLVVIDVYSRRLWLRPMKRKTGVVVFNTLKNVIETMDRHVHAITSDRGPEFVNREMQDYLTSIGVKQYLVDPDDSKRPGGGQPIGIVDRVIRTTRNMLYRVWESEGTREWVSILPEIESNYNSRVHSTIKATPMSVWMGNAEPAQQPDPPQALFNIGERVRHILLRPKFTKGGAEWSKQVYVIVQKTRDRYAIAPGANAESLPNTYRAYELQRVEGENDDEASIEVDIKASDAKRRQMRRLRKEGLIN